MNRIEAAMLLAGVTSGESKQASAPTNVHLISGEVSGVSEDGIAKVAIDGLVFSEADDQYIEIDTLGGLEDGDIVTIMLSGEPGGGMTPLAIGGSGTIDRISLRVKDIEADYVKTDELEANYAHISEGVIDNATIGHANIDGLSTAYAQIDGANITTATIRESWINKVMVQSGLIAQEGTVYTLDALQVNAENITAGTIDVERLIVTVNGEKYMVHIDPTTSSPTYEKLDGNIIEDLTITADKIVAGTITADKITTNNLVGTGGWINLRNGTFAYANSTTGEGISWDGSHLSIGGASQLGNSTVNDIIDDIAEVADAVDNISIGGRNLLRGTASPINDSEVNITRATIENGGVIRIKPTTSAGYAVWRVRYLDFADFGYGDYVVSLDVRQADVESSYTSHQLNVVLGYCTESTYTSSFSNNANAKYKSKSVSGITAEWQRVEVAFKFPDDLTSGSLVVTDGCFLKLHLSGSAKTAPIEVRRVKLERGNRATDWSPAPEDDERRANIFRCTNQLIDLIGYGGVGYWSDGTWHVGSGTASNGNAEIVALSDPPETTQCYGFRVWSTTSGNKDVGQKKPPFVAGERYIFSCWARLTPDVEQASATAQMRVYGLASESATSASALKTSTMSLTSTEWVRWAYVFILTEEQLENQTGSWPGILLGVKGKGDIQICGVKLEPGYYATGWAPSPYDSVSATQTSSREQTIYYSASSGTSSISANTTWVTDATGAQNTWTTVRPEYSQSYPVLLVAHQRQTVSQVSGTSCSCTTPIVDKTTTIIDGGHIITGTIDASKLNAADINASNTLTIGALDSDTQGAILNSNISVGGRNLLRYVVYNYADSSSAISVNSAYRGMYCAVDGGETYTISRRIVEGNRFWIEWSEQEPASDVTLHPLSKDNTVLKVTVDVPSEANWLFIYLSNQNDVINDGNIKVERGNKPTDWTPAPEDVDASISEASKTATNYITADSTGIKIHMSDSPTTYQHQSSTATTYYVSGNKRAEVSANGLEVFDGTYNSEESVASFGTVARLGKANGNKVIVDSTGVHIYNVQESQVTPIVTQVAEFGQAPGELTTTMLSDEPAIGTNYPVPSDAIEDEDISIMLDDQPLEEDTDYTLSSGIVTLLESTTVTSILDDSGSGSEESSEDVGTHSLTCEYTASAGVGLAIGASVTRPGLDVAERAIFRHPSFVEATHGTANADTGYRASRTDTGIQVFCGIGIGGVNHGVYSHVLNRWLINADRSTVHVAPHTVTDGNINIKSKYVYATTPSASKGNGWGHGLQYLDTAGTLVGVAKAYSLTTGEKGIQLSATRKVGSTTVNNGIMLGVDSSGNRKLTFNGGGRLLWRQALGFDSGYVSASYGGSNNAPSNAYRDIPITFNFTHTYAPHVVVSFASGSTGVTMGGLSLSAFNVTTTGCTVRIYNNTSDVRNPPLYWVAID